MKLLERLISVKNEGNYKVFTVFGLRIRIFRPKTAISHLQEECQHLREECQSVRELRDSNRELRKDFQEFREYHQQFLERYDQRAFISAMWRSGANEDLLRYCGFVARSPHAWKTYPHQFWLVYLACLIEIGNMQKAQDILKKYVNHRGLLDIELYLPVAKLALDNGIANENIKKAAFAHDKLMENRPNLFKNVLDGKTIAVVGNGPSEIGKNRGAEIDAHDIVIRFNNYQTIGFEKDYGTKTDVWARGGSTDVHDRGLAKYKLIVWAIDYNRRAVLPGFDVLYRQLATNEPVYMPGSDTHRALRQASELDNPTTGAILVWEIYEKFGSFDNVNFYGFNYLQDNFDTFSVHYFNDRSIKKAEQKSRLHRLYDEAIFLKRFIGNNGRLDLPVNDKEL